MVIFRLKRGRIYKTGLDVTPQGVSMAILQSATIRALYDNDYHATNNPTGLTPAEQREALLLLPGLTAKEMEAIIPLTGPALADTIRSVISSHRAQNRTDKDKQKPR